MNWKDEYSEEFDKLRKNRIEVSYHKYGTAKDNFGQHLVNAIESHDLCIKKYQETGNTMFEYMYPNRKDAYFKATSSSESAGISGVCVKDLGKDKAFERMLDR